MMWQRYFQPTSLPEALNLLAEHAGEARIVAGGTDLVVELGRGIRPTGALIDITRVSDLAGIAERAGEVVLGALTTHNDVIASPLCREALRPLTQASQEVGAPQLRTRATVVGNLVTASPANDTIAPLVALGASLVLASVRGERVVPIEEFYLGVRRTVLAPDELVREIRVTPLPPGARSRFVKLGLRRAQAISVVDAALVVVMDGDTVGEARIALGSVAPTIVRAGEAEAFLRGKALDSATCAEAGRLAAAAANPIGDVRGSADYRRTTIANLVADALLGFALGDEGDIPDDPVLLATGRIDAGAADPYAGVIETVVNGQPRSLDASGGTTLLHALRDEAGLTGAKPGCEEGECGACTVWIDGMAVMSCLVPAPQAHGREVVTIEGLAATKPEAADGLHPVQRSFVACGAVQCGYCIPGMVMAAAKLLDERSGPNRAAIETGLSGNLCRCTGYRKIFDAVVSASAECRVASAEQGPC